MVREDGFYHNLGQVFEPIVSVEAWRTRCNAEEVGSVHVDLTFLDALLGAEPESPIRFRAALKRAVLKVHVSQRDPIKVVRSSVDRGDLSITEHKQSRTVTSKLSASGGAQVGAGRVPIKANVEAGGAYSATSSETFEKARKIREFEVTQFSEGEKYCWEIIPRNEGAIIGKIWDALKEPRLSTLLTSANALSADCEVRVIVECPRQDIDIRDVQLKDKKLSLPAFRGSKNNVLAAEAVIRELLFKKGFSVDNFSEPFSSVIMTSISVMEE